MIKCLVCGTEYNEKRHAICPGCFTPNEFDSLKFFVSLDLDESNEFISEDGILIDQRKTLIDEKDIYANLCDEFRNLSKRSKNCLISVNITNFDELMEFLNNGDLRSIPNLGAKSENEINDMIKQYKKENGVVDEIAEVDDEEYIMDISELSVRSKNALVNTGIITVSQLNEFVINHSLNDIKNLGMVSRDEILRFLNMKSFKNEVKETNKAVPTTMLASINKEYLDSDVNILMSAGVARRIANKMHECNVHVINDIYTMSITDFLRLFPRYYDDILTAESHLRLDAKTLLEQYLTQLQDNQVFDMALHRAEGCTLQEISEICGLTRERIRQKLSQFYEDMSEISFLWVKDLMNGREYVPVNEIISFFDNEKFGKILYGWVQNNKYYEYLDFAEKVVFAKDEVVSIEKRITELVLDFVEDEMDAKESFSELEYMMVTEGFSYLSESDIENLLSKNGYYHIGKYFFKPKPSYAYLCSKCVEEKFPNGIKLYEEEDLDLLRKYAYEEYGDIGIPIDNHAFASRLSAFLIQSGRGMAIAEKYVDISNDLLEQIKKFIDAQKEREIYYSYIFSHFEEQLLSSSNVNNSYFLHGVLKLFYPEDYDYNRDYLCQKGEDYLSGSHFERIKRVIINNGHPVSKKQLIKEIPGLNNGIIAQTAINEKDFLIWDYDQYFLLDFVSYDDHDIFCIKNIIENIMKDFKGCCSEGILYNTVKKEYNDFLIRNNMNMPNNFFYFVNKVLGDEFDIRKPNICRKGLLKEITSMNVALHLLDYPVEFSYKEFVELTEILLWPSISISFVLEDITKLYYRISFDGYRMKDKVLIEKEIIEQVEEVIFAKMTDGFLAISTINDYSSYPDLEFEWNPYLLRSIVDNYDTKFKVIDSKMKDRRVEKGVFVLKESSYTELSDIVVDYFINQNRKEISKKEMLRFLSERGLARKIIPYEFYVSEKMSFKDEVFRINE